MNKHIYIDLELNRQTFVSRIVTNIFGKIGAEQFFRVKQIFFLFGVGQQKIFVKHIFYTLEHK